MNLAHFHVLITHLPVFAAFIGILVLLYGGIKQSQHTIQAAYLIFILSAIGAGMAYFTGEHAEEFIEHMPGISHDAIHEHEEAAKFTWITAIIYGLASIIGLYFLNKKSNYNNLMRYIILGISIFALSTAVRTAYLGGKVRHTEFSSTTNTNIQQENDHD